MREILFRAWDGKRYSIGNPEYFDDSVNFRFHHFDINCEKPILEQFTGLTDKNGNKIFEGDVIEYPPQRKKFIVEFHNDCFGARDKKDKRTRIGSGDDFIIIGNIHDNPELLK